MWNVANLHAGAIAVARGDLDHSIVQETGDEIGDLAVAFAQMTRSVRENQERLAARMREITTLHEIGRAVSSVLGLDEVLRKIVEEVAHCDLLYVTPGHQSPTTATLTPERRRALMALARERDLLIVEDDYEIETSFAGRPEPALKSQDADGRVLYVGSLSKTLSPGLRLGYMVAPEPVIREARLLRRLMVRHAAVNNQRAAALFLSEHTVNDHVKAILAKTGCANRQVLLSRVAG